MPCVLLLYYLLKAEIFLHLDDIFWDYNILIKVVDECVKAFSKVKMLLYGHRSTQVMTEMFLNIDKLSYTCRSQNLHNVMWKPKRAFDIRLLLLQPSNVVK